MEDSTAMTIDFLRARLQSERSISRTAKQRADQLAQRVKELEEQLKFVSIQRKKAEKAAAEVLAILESHGINDSFEASDSSSDQDELCESKENSSPVKEAEHPMTSKTRTEAGEGLSGSEVEASSTRRSLSWKSGSSHSNSSGRKYLAQARRRHNSFISTGGSSPMYRLGKSCREIKRRETRTAAEDVRDASLLLDAQENAVATGLGNVSDHFDCRPDNLNGCLQKEENSMLPEKQIIENGGSLHANGRDKYGDMERALEQQAQLIGRFEAEENAQREWEEKYRENNYVGEPQDSCEPGNQSDVTEEKSEPQTNEDTEHMVTFSSYDGAKLKTSKVQCVKEVTTGTPSSGHVPTDSTAHNQSNLNPRMDMPGQQRNIMGVNESEMGFPEFVFPAEVYPLDKREVKKTDIMPVVDSNLKPHPHESPRDGTLVNSSLWADRNFSKGELSGSQNQHDGTLLQSSNSLGGVLEALQRAKVSLQHELKLPSASHGAMITLPHTRTHSLKASDAIDTPPSTAGLFRVPSEQYDYDSPFPSFSRAYSDFESTRHSGDTNFSTISSYQYPTNPYIETGSRISQPYFDSYTDSGLGNPSINRYSNPQMDLSRAIVPTNAGHPSPYSVARPGMPFGDNYSIYDQRFRSGMYR